MWEIEILKMVRYLIGDFSASPENSDQDIINTIVVAAQLTQRDVDFEQTYEIDVDATTISPDPTTNGVDGRPKDDAFINLVALKTACIISTGDAHKAAKSALVVSDGLSRIDTSPKAKMLMDIKKTVCEAYLDAVQEFEMGHSVPGMAILGPYSDGHFWYGQSYPDMRSREIF